MCVPDRERWARGHLQSCGAPAKEIFMAFLPWSAPAACPPLPLLCSPEVFCLSPEFWLCLPPTPAQKVRLCRWLAVPSPPPSKLTTCYLWMVSSLGKSK